MTLRNRLTRLESRHKGNVDDPVTVIFVRAVDKADVVGPYCIAYILGGGGSITPLPGEREDEFEARAHGLAARLA